MKKLYSIFVLVSACLLVSGTLSAGPIEQHLIEGSSQLFNQEIGTANPLSLSPQWWKHYEVTGKDLVQRIQKTSEVLHGVLPTLSAEEQEIAYPRITSIISNLNTYATAKNQKEKDAVIPHAYSKAYTLDDQLEINRKIRKLTLDKTTEQEELAQQKIKIQKALQYIDNLMVKYLSNTKASSEKLLAGLEIMSRRTSLALAEQNLKTSQSRLDSQEAKLEELQKELLASIELLDLHQFDERQMEKEAQKAQVEYDKAQADLATAEGNSLTIFGDTSYDRAMRFWMEQRVLYANTNFSLAWAKLSFQLLKFNLIMDYNGRFPDGDGHDKLLKEIQTWKDRVAQLTTQMPEVRAAALKEEDRVRHEYALLVDSHDNRLLKVIQNRKQESLNTLTLLQLLEESLVDVQWMINVLETHIKEESSFITLWWRALEGAVIKAWSTVVHWANFSLFKVSGVPITFIMLLEVTFIMVVSFYISKLIRAALNGIVRRRGNMSDDTIFQLSRVLHYFILIIGLCVALLSIGLDFGNLLILASALTFGLGFGLQSVANNIICGVRILMERKLKVGDYVELHSGCSGKVTEIQLQHTVVATNDGSEIIVPNSELIDKTLVNWTMTHDYKRLHIPFAVASDSNKDLVRRVVVEAAYNVSCTVADHKKLHTPQVWLVNFGENSLDFELVVWVNVRVKAKTDSREADYLWEIETALRGNNISMPMQEQRLYLEHKRSIMRQITREPMPISVPMATPDKFQVHL